MDLSKLKLPFHPNDIEWRAAQAGENDNGFWVKVLAYVTNRAIMERLDDVCGPENWRNEYKDGPGGGVLCGLSIRYGDEWITKWDGADNTNIEAVKGGLSGAMKRAGSQWGIGRYLYNLEEGWGVVGKNGKFSGKTKDNKWFKWNPPELPDWALPKGTGKEKKPTAPIDKILAKINSFEDAEKFQDYLDKHWATVEHTLKDAPVAFKQAHEAMEKKMDELGNG
jgi:hypothetical protein